jgi:hypothetical protein
LADLTIETFAMESAWLRAQKAVLSVGEADAKHKLNMATVFINSNLGKLAGIATEALAALAEGDEFEKTLEELQAISKFTPKNVIALRREIAATISGAGKYVS